MNKVFNHSFSTGNLLRLVKCPTRTVSAGKSLVITARIQIDRRKHLEAAFERQEMKERQLAEDHVSCPIDCVREVSNLAELEWELDEGERANQLVVVDFFNSSCGACKYVLPQMVKLCKKGCEEECQVDQLESSVRFIKHNIRDEYDDLTDIARLYRIKHVPIFSFFIDGCRMDQIATRNKKRLTQVVALLLERFHETGRAEGKLEAGEI